MEKLKIKQMNTTVHFELSPPDSDFYTSGGEEKAVAERGLRGYIQRGGFRGGGREEDGAELPLEI